MKVLVANRGEIAVRILRAIQQVDGQAVAAFAADDAAAMHVLLAGESVELPGHGAAAYLDIAAIVEAARRSGCDAVHPGYGFLSESAAFARACRAAGLRFIGPTPEVLELFGNKVTARATAQQAGIPVPAGLPGPVTVGQVREFFASHGPVMIKAVSGGGGRGMQAVHDLDGLDEAFERCASEALASFGDADLYVEVLLPQARHIEVQVVADSYGTVTHLWERDCSIQRRHQKLVEVAPSPSLDPVLRERIIAAAVDLASFVNYTGIGTFEFLVHGEDFWFMEANPRLQVEHTVTEVVTGVDLVVTQLQIAAGATIAGLGLDTPPTPRGYAIQSRVNAETLGADGSLRAATGRITALAVPSGPGIRVDTAAYAGWVVNPRYDSLLAKVVSSGDDFESAARRGARALVELDIEGLSTNRSLLHAVLTDPDFLLGAWDTGFLAERLAGYGAHTLPASPLAAVAARDEPPAPADATRDEILPEGVEVVRAPMTGVVVSIQAPDAGRIVASSATLVVLEAMKMEHAVRAEGPRRIVRTLVAVGDLVEVGTPLLQVQADDTDTVVEPSPGQADEATGVQDDWAPEVAEIAWRSELADGLGGPAKIQRQRATGRLTARERISAIADPGTFSEIGKLAGFATRDELGRTLSVSPTNFLAGTARIDGRKAVLGVDDFTVRGGSGDAAIHAKQIWLEEYALEARLPMIRLLDGQSGGGSVKMALDAGYTYVPYNPAWDAVTRGLSVIPVVAAALGPTVGLGAARLVMSHLAILVEGIGQVFTAGPPLVRQATGEDLTKEQLGGADVHRANGTVERVVGSEAEAFAVIRRFLSYLPTSVYEAPPVAANHDPVERREEALLSAVPRNKRTTYRIQPVLDAVFDEGSVFPYAEYGGAIVTALARLDGHPVGVIASDPVRGSTMSLEGAQAITRLVDLCETFHLPIVSLTDQAGMTIGLAAEKCGTIRAGARAITAVYQARVPQAEVILRRVYGVGGAGIVNRHRAQRSWAWPSGDWGSLPTQGGVEAAFGAQISASADPALEVERLRREVAHLGSPFRTAERFGIQDLIDPRDTRALLCDWVHDAYRIVPTLLSPPSFGTRP